MPRDPLGERWVETYRDAPEVFELFSRAQDRGGILSPELIEKAGLGGRRVLEIGCGSGRWTRDLAAAAASYVALEPVPGLLALALRKGGPRAHWLRARAQALPFSDGAFERVVALWVFANLRRGLLQGALDEARRALRPGAELWVVENHWEDEFQALRREAGSAVQVEVAPLLAAGFELATTLETEMCFESPAEARRVLGQILGARVERELASRPRARFLHRMCLLRDRKPSRQPNGR